MTDAERYCTVYSANVKSLPTKKPKNLKPISDEVRERRNYIRNHEFVFYIDENGKAVGRVASI